eukprot:jgi/Galph1/5677/GphlegSOOS_G4326.1
MNSTVTVESTVGNGESLTPQSFPKEQNWKVANGNIPSPRISINSNAEVLLRSTNEELVVEAPPEAKNWDVSKLPLALRVNGRYVNPWETWHWKGFWDLLRWKLFTPDKSSVPSKDVLDKSLPVLPVDPPYLATEPSTYGFRLTWFGHSSVLIQFEGFNILMDPIFSRRCSPLKYFGPKRYRNAPCSIDDLPSIDIILISHDHYDHFDERTIRKILMSPKNRKVYIFVPEGILSRVQRLGLGRFENATFKELLWWQKARIGDRLTIILSPVQHWSKRTAFDIFETLWGGFIVIGKSFRFFFSGDTAYCPVFSTIGELYGPFDCAAIPIGAYSPRWFMKGQHVDPYEAVKIHKDIRSKFSVAIHWGTFVLTNEYYLEPPKLLQDAMKKANVSKEEFIVLKHGESIEKNFVGN